jgi:dolichol kinase
MSSQTLSFGFSEKGELLRQALLQMELDLHSLQESSSELYQQLCARALQNWETLSTRFENYRLSVKKMPKELRQRDFVKSMLAEMERFEMRAQAHMAELRLSHGQSLENSTSGFSARFKEQINSLSAQITMLQQHPLINRYESGEMILSCHKNLQWGRKLGHMFCGLSFLYFVIFSGLPKTFIWTLVTAFLVWGFSLETIRHLNPRVNDWVCRVFKPVMREREKRAINSGIFYMLSMLLIYFIFPLNVAILTMLFIAVGDTAAGVVGVKWGRHKISKDVSWEGALACFITCAFMALIAHQYLFDGFILSGGFKLFFFCVVSGLIGAFAESSLKNWDDNLVMPILSAPGLFLLMQILS